MRVTSPLADMQITVGAVHRDGSVLVLQSGAGSSLDTTICIGAREALRIVGRILGSTAGLSFVLGLPLLALRRDAGTSAGAGGSASVGGAASAGTDINKPW
ncbi:MAG: hypothetical protein JSS24_04905 [Proteobacteria bacterium]|nr:hypothetical protein [Pseudomonadota bacterium]